MSDEDCVNCRGTRERWHFWVAEFDALLCAIPSGDGGSFTLLGSEFEPVEVPECAAE